MSSTKKASLLLASSLLLSNILGFLRNVILAKFVIPFDYLDAYFAAFRWPDLIFNLLITGAVSTVLVPLYTEIKIRKSTTHALQYVSKILSTTLLVLVILLTIMFFLLPFLTRFLVAGASPEIRALTLNLGRILLLSPFFFGISYIVSAVLLAEGKFFLYALAPLLYNLAIITGGLGYNLWGIYGLVGFVILGTLFHLGIQLPGLKGLPIQILKKPAFLDSEIIRTLKLALPRTLSLTTSQIQLILLTLLASYTGAKSIAIFNLANDFATTPTVIVANALAIALFPRLSSAWAERDLKQFEETAAKALKLVIFLLTPSALGMWVLRAQLTRLYLALGKSLAWEATIKAINTLGMFSIGILFAGAIAIFLRIKYAQHDTKKPMIYSFFAVIFSLPFAAYFTFFSKLNVAGLALSYSISQIILASLLYLDLRKIVFLKTFKKDLRQRLLPQTFIFSLTAGISCWLSLRVADYFVDTHRVIGLLLQTLVGLTIFSLIFFGLAKLAKNKEMELIFSEISLKTILLRLNKKL